MCQAYDAEWSWITDRERRRAEAIGHGDCKNCGLAAREHDLFFPYQAVIDRTTTPWTWCEGFVR